MGPQQLRHLGEFRAAIPRKVDSPPVGHFDLNCDPRPKGSDAFTSLPHPPEAHVLLEIVFRVAGGRGLLVS